MLGMRSTTTIRSRRLELVSWSGKLARRCAALPRPSVKGACVTVHGHSATGNVRCGLSNPSKMPGKGWSLPALLACPTGAKLAKVAGTVCSTCYACSGRYTETGVAASLRARWDRVNEAIESLEGAAAWCAAMAKLISKQSPAEFRWHDSGDVFSDKYLAMIFQVCRMTRKTKHWLPTKEFARFNRVLVKGGHAVPRNLCVRISAFKLGERLTIPAPLYRRGIRSSSVGASEHGSPERCPAPDQDGFCGPCRRCWDRGADNSDYVKH